MLRMDRNSHLVVPGLPDHLTPIGVRSMSIFRNEEDREAYLQGSSPHRVGKNELINSRKACPIKGLVVASGLEKVL